MGALRFQAGCCDCGSEPTTTFHGNLTGCGAAGVPGSVEIRDGSTTLWAGPTDANGAFSGSVALGSTTTVSVIGTPTSPRLVATTVSRTLTAGVANNLGAVQASPATGMVCLTICPLPVSTHLFIDDTQTGDTNLEIDYGANIDGNPNQWEARDSSGNLWTLDINANLRQNGSLVQLNPSNQCDPLIITRAGIHVTE